MRAHPTPLPVPSTSLPAILLEQVAGDLQRAKEDGAKKMETLIEKQRGKISEVNDSFASWSYLS